MNYPGVVNKNKETLSKIITLGSRPNDGHAPLLSGKSLYAYVIVGLGSDHQCTNAKEAMEKLRMGMHIMIRQGTHEKNLQDLIVMINEFKSSHMSLVSDDRSPADLKENGHIDYLIQSAISLGLTPIRAIQMGSINNARYFGLKNLGAIAPGFKADFVLLDDLESFKISQAFLDGKPIENLGPNRTGPTDINDKNFLHDFPFLRNTMHVKSLDNPNMFTIHTISNDVSSTLMQVIGVIPGQIITQKRTLPASVNGRCEAIADATQDLAKLTIIERHHRTGNIGLGFVQGLGLEKGAIASSVTHDSHNLVVAGMDDLDMLIAARDVSSIGEGLSVVIDKQVISNFPLPIAGLMSDADMDSVITSLDILNTACLKLGVKVIKDPFMLLSFLALPVIPSLKFTDNGLVDVDNFRYTSLWID